MERWAKNVNAAKSIQQQQIHAVIEQERGEVAVLNSNLLGSNSLSESQKSGVPLSAALHMVDLHLHTYPCQVILFSVTE